MRKKILITGGAGYIGSHTCVELLRENHDVLVFDDLSNSSEEALRRVEMLTNRKLELVIGDIRNKSLLFEVMKSFNPDSVLHFAGRKSVSESVEEPLLYYDVNVSGSINLLSIMSLVGCTEIVFSSSATVYGEASVPPFSETSPTSPVNPYGQSKLAFERVLQDWVIANDRNRAVVLRYFNPVGAHDSGLLGENPMDAPNNLMPIVARVAQGKLAYLSVYGSDYDTRDGTGERDYIHVSDLAIGHSKALKKITELKRFQILNLGTGRSVTVKELVRTFETSCNVSVPIRFVNRRLGDVSRSYANSALAKKLLNFDCERSLDQICVDTWNWTQKNPDGYK